MRKDPWVLVAGGFHRNGGMDRANLALAEYLMSEGIPVHLVTHSADKSVTDNPLIKTHLVARPLSSFTLGGPLLDLKGRGIAKSVTKRYRDAKVVVNGSNCGWPGINWAHYIHHAWCPALQGGNVIEKTAKMMAHNLDKRRERAAYRRSPMVIANSELTRRHIIEHCSIAPGRVRTLYLGSDPTWTPVTPPEHESARGSFAVREAKYSAAFVGALGTDNRKGIDTLLAAWRILCKDYLWDVDLLVAGNGRQLSSLMPEVAAWGLSDRIRLLGFCPDVRRLLAACDLLVSPVRYEAYGLNVQEAICRGIPSIVSASAGIAERYPDDLRMFLLSNPESVEELVRRLRLWRSSAARWKALFEPFGAALRRNTWQDMARQLVSFGAEPQSATECPQAARVSRFQ